MKKPSIKQKKIERVMHEFKEGDLHSGSKKGPQVKSRKQAIAIALSEARNMKKQTKADKMDESLGMRRGKESTKTQSYKSRRDESKGSKKK